MATKKGSKAGKKSSASKKGGKKLSVKRRPVSKAAAKPARPRKRNRAIARQAEDEE